MGRECCPSLLRIVQSALTTCGLRPRVWPGITWDGVGHNPCEWRELGVIVKGCSRGRGAWLAGFGLFDRESGMVVAVSFLSKMGDKQAQVVEGMSILSAAVLNGNRQGGVLHSGEQKPLPAWIRLKNLQGLLSSSLSLAVSTVHPPQKEERARFKRRRTFVDRDWRTEAQNWRRF